MKKIIAFLTFALALASCAEKPDINDFVSEYIHTVSKEHDTHRTNITENMSPYFMDDEHGASAPYPEFAQPPSGFSDKIFIVDDGFAVLNVEKSDALESVKNAYDVTVEYSILGEVSDGKFNAYATAKKKETVYWVVLHKNRYYIYADATLQFIYILKSDFSY